MSEFEELCSYEQTIFEITRATTEDEVESHPDFSDLSEDQQERVRQWVLQSVTAGFLTAMGIRRTHTNHRSALLANTAAFLEETEIFADGQDEKAGVLQ